MNDSGAHAGIDPAGIEQTIPSSQPVSPTAPRAAFTGSSASHPID
jgi:hypothetical protein